MSESTDKATPAPEQTLTRREALKTLAAVTGAATLASLPKQWETPLIEIGALPAHAQGSELVIPEVIGIGSTETYTGIGGFSYFDGAGQVDDSASLVASLGPCNEIVFDGPLSNTVPLGGPIPGSTAVNGVILFLFNSATKFCGLNSTEICVELEVGGRRASNCGPFQTINQSFPDDLENLGLDFFK
jgi:hypothetical protein